MIRSLSKHFHRAAERSRRAFGSLAPVSRGLGEACLDILAPGYCRECGGSVERGVHAFCDACLGGIEWIDGSCARCATPIVSPPLPGSAASRGCGWCLGRKLCFDAASAGGIYRGALRTAVLHYKFHGDLGVLPLLRAALERAARAPSIAEALRDAGAIVPVPVHPLKRFWRGWDPLRALAEALAASLPGRVPILPLLAKVRWTPSQVSLDEDARRRNLRGAFKVRRGAPVPGTVVLIDDVLTTATTASRAAETLKRGGAETVILVVPARS